MAELPHQLVTRQRRDRIDRGGVNEPLHPALFAGLHHILRPLDVHIPDQVFIPRVDINHARKVINDIRPFKRRFERFGVGHVAKDLFTVQPVKQRDILTDQDAHPLAAVEQLLQKGVANMAGRTGQNA